MPLTRISALPTNGAPSLWACAQNAVVQYAQSGQLLQLTTNVVVNPDQVFKDVVTAYQQDYAKLRQAGIDDAIKNLLEGQEDDPLLNTEFGGYLTKRILQDYGIEESVENEVSRALVTRYFGEKNGKALIDHLIWNNQCKREPPLHSTAVLDEIMREVFSQHRAYYDNFYANEELKQIGEGKYCPNCATTLFKDFGGAIAIQASLEPL